MTIDDNPFERWGLDPTDDGRRLTQSMRRKTRELDADERTQLQQDWRLLTTDPVTRARWALLTPPQVCDADSPWAEAEALVSPTAETKLPALEATIDDGLALPKMADGFHETKPPFLPRLARRERRRNFTSAPDVQEDS